MGLDVELEFEKYCKVVRSPKVGVATHRRSSRTEGRTEKVNPLTREGYLIRNVDDDFTEISFSRSRSSSYKNMVHPAARAASNEKMKRNSLYQCSKDIKQMQNNGDLDVRRKIELSPSGDSYLPFRLFADKASALVDQKKYSMLSLDEETKQFPVSKTHPEADPPELIYLSSLTSTPDCVKARSVSSDSSIAISVDSRDGKDCSAGNNERGLREKLNFRSYQTFGPLNDGNGLSERDAFRMLHKSSSEKVGKPNSPRGRESDYCKTSGKGRFSPFRRMFDPIMKSKSMRSSPISRAEVGYATTTGLENPKRNRTLCKSLLNDFSNTAYKTEFSTQSVKKEQPSSVTASSPAHLLGNLTLELKQGVPHFEFSMKDTEDVLSSKTWRVKNAFNWVYTFHSMNRKRTSNSSGQGTRERRNESSMVGQMQVSCFFLSEVRSNGAFDNSMVTEFVLYDIMHARRSLAAKDSSCDSVHSVKPMKDITGENPVRGPCFDTKEFSYVSDQKLCAEDTSDNFDASTHYPWAPIDLHPDLEIAAIVIQVPFERRESLKEKRGDRIGGKEPLNLFDFSAIDQKTGDAPKNISCVKVITPSGTHGLPSETESGGPSPLLERWRSGGNCDCGGWDMACPLLVFDDRGVQNMVDQPLTDSQRHIQLFYQGPKEKEPAVTITFIREGQYSVDFHARLSKLQAFSICVAILHGSEACAAVVQEENKKLPCNPLKVLLDEEVKFLIGAVADKEKRKLTQPNLSPIARS